MNLQTTNTGTSGDEAQLQAMFAERLKQLPRPLQDAIQSADVDIKLRTISQRHAIHVDQGAVLENEVKLTLYGFEKVENLAHNIQTEVGLDAATAQQLAEEISSEIFEPIREQLERNLDHPDAKSDTMTDAETTRTRILDKEHAEGVAQETSAPVVQPATPPAPKPDIKITRPSESTAYRPGEASTERKVVHDDPYRVPPV